MISAKPNARMTSPMATAGRYVSTTIQTRMVGSMERYLTLARAWPSFSSGRGASRSCRSPGARRPFGRECNCSWRLVTGISEGNIFVRDFGNAAGRAAGTAVGVVSGRGMAFEVIAAGAGACATTGAGCGCAFGAAAEHSEVVGYDFEAGALLAFLVLPLAGLDTAFDEDERALLEILLRDLRLLAPDDDFVPLGALLLFAVAVFVGFVRGYGEIGDGLAAAGVARFGIASQTANENNFVYRH